MKLIDNANKWYAMTSQQALITIASLQVMLAAFPEKWVTAQVPYLGMTYGDLAVALTGAAAVIGFIGRLIKQAAVSGTETAP